MAGNSASGLFSLPGGVTIYLPCFASKANGARGQRAQGTGQIQPDYVPANLVETLQSAFDYVDLVRNSLADNKLSRGELDQIARLGANVSAGLNMHGG